ncbi:MAG: hypothetical protein LC122_14190 [Chitinophagales bacterium]|nr:hypothetical protein [Chitinophagales bacterium]
MSVLFKTIADFFYSIAGGTGVLIALIFDKIFPSGSGSAAAFGKLIIGMLLGAPITIPCIILAIIFDKLSEWTK